MEIDSKPIIYYFGHESAKDHLQELVSAGLAAQPAQWSRRSNQDVQNVIVDPIFLPLVLPSDSKSNDTNASSHPAIYTFFCPNDPEFYAEKGQKAFGQWFSFLSENRHPEWLIITITDKSKKVSHRNSVATRLKNDFSVDFTGRIHDIPSNYNEFPGTLQNLNAKIREAVVSVFGNTLDDLEIRAAKLLEQRKEKNWDFMEYFLCLEETASLYSCMDLYDRALECMEKAGKQLTIALASETTHDPSSWLERLLSNNKDGHLVRESSVVSTFESPARAARVRRREAGLFEVRAHLLTRECALLQALDRIHQLPKRVLTTLTTCLREARYFNLSISPVELYLWIFICTMETIGIFRRAVHFNSKNEDFIHLRNKFWQANNLPPQLIKTNHPNLLSLTSTSTGNSVINGFTDEESYCQSSVSDVSASTLITVRMRAMEFLDLLDDSALEEEGTFSMLARVVLETVVVDDHCRSGRVAAQNKHLVGTSKYTVALWRRACVALGRLGRYTELWPIPGNSDHSKTNGSFANHILKVLSSANSPREASSFEAKLAVAFVSPESFKEVYQKFAGASVFFLSCSDFKRASICSSLELADFYRDGGDFLKAESLYHRATKIFLRDSWTELATYSLLQQAFCQQVQWRTENVDSIEASVFSRYIQTCLLLAMTPNKYLEHCYDLLKRQGAYFDHLFGERSTPDEYKSFVPILPPWWPEDWWTHAFETLVEQEQRVNQPPLIADATLRRLRPLAPLQVHALGPLFRLLDVELEEANPQTHCQVIRVHLRLNGVRPMLLRVTVGARITTASDWKAAPLAPQKPPSSPLGDSVKLFNVDLATEGVLVSIIHSNATTDTQRESYAGESSSSSSFGHSQGIAGSRHSIAATNGSTTGSSESVIQRLFRRSSVKGRLSRSLFKKTNVIASSQNQLDVLKSAKRPTSIDFIGYRGRLNTMDKINPLPADSILDGLALSAERVAATPENASTTDDSVFSGKFTHRSHKKGRSLSDLSSFMQGLLSSKTQSPMKETGNMTDKNVTSNAIFSTTSEVIDKGDVRFYSRAHSTNLLDRKLTKSPGGQQAEDSDENGPVFIFHPGDNYLFMETKHYGFHLPKEITISLYSDEESVAEDTPAFVFTGPISPEQFGRTWSNEALLDRLLPTVEQVEAIRVSGFPTEKLKNKASACVLSRMSQPLFLTVRIGSLSIEHCESSSRNGDSHSVSVGSDYDVGLRLLRKPAVEVSQGMVWGQRYEVEATAVASEEEESEGTPAWSDLGDLILAPGEKAPPEDHVFPPGTRLCPRRSVVFCSNVNEEVYAILPMGRPYPINLVQVGALIFKAKVTTSPKKDSLLVQLIITAREGTWPVLGSATDSNWNPLYCQEGVAFSFTSPSLTFRHISQDSSRRPSTGRGPQINNRQRPPLPPPTHRPNFPEPSRSISVVDVISPTTPLVVAAAQLKAVGDGKAFFPSSGESSKAEGNGSTPSRVSTSSLSGVGPVRKLSGMGVASMQAPILLLEPPESEWIVCSGRPLVLAWRVEAEHFNFFLRPMPNTDKQGIFADFGFRAKTKFDRKYSRVQYTCTLVKVPRNTDATNTLERSMSQNGLSGIFARGLYA